VIRGTSDTKEAVMLRTFLPTNEGIVDRTIRFLAGAGILSLAFIGPETPWGYLGVIPLVTAIVGSCPLYTLLGMNTCPATPK
jgi:hypothetical protein